jgi:uncharacterized protein (TIGR04255 family)
MENIDTITYKNNFLSKVIFRIDTSIILSTEDKIKDFQSAVKDFLPILEPVAEKHFAINAGVEGQFSAENSTKVSWHFKSRDKNLECEINESSITVISKKYTNFLDFKDILLPILSAYEKVRDGVFIKRVGFRYINEISFPDDVKISEYLIPWLHRDDTFLESGHNKLRGVSRYEISISEISRMILNFGVFNSAYPAPASGNEFILD